MAFSPAIHYKIINTLFLLKGILIGKKALETINHSLKKFVYETTGIQFWKNYSYAVIYYQLNCSYCSMQQKQQLVANANKWKCIFSVTNASPATTSYGVYSDTTNIYTTGTLGYSYTTGVTGGNPYSTITSGNHSIKLISGGNSVFLDSNRTFTNGGYYSFFVYDTGIQIKTLALNDNLTPPASGSAEVRFLNLSPNSQLLNVWRVNIGTTSKDSLLLSGIPYIGSFVANTDSLSSFKTVMAGTYKVLLNSTTELNLFQNDSVTFEGRKIYTIYAKGYVNGINGEDSLGLGIIENY